MEKSKFGNISAVHQCRVLTGWKNNSNGKVVSRSMLGIENKKIISWLSNATM